MNIRPPVLLKRNAINLFAQRILQNLAYIVISWQKNVENNVSLTYCELITIVNYNK